MLETPSHAIKENFAPSHTLHILTKELAQSHAAALAALADQIPLVTYTVAEILAESKPGRPFYGKWDRSLLLTDTEGAVRGFIAGYERAADGSAQYPEPSVYISELAVHPDHQGRQLGRKLVETFIAHNESIGMVQHPDAELRFTIQTNADEALNGHVIRLYQSLGFSEIARKPYDNREDLVMSR